MKYLRAHNKLLILLLALAFVGGSLMALWHFYAIGLDKDGKMTPCGFMGETAMCKMDIFQHITLWQSMFSALPQYPSPLYFLVLAALLIIISLLYRNTFEATTQKSAVLVPWQSLVFFVIDPLQLAFSQGILNPKIYEPAAVL